MMPSCRVVLSYSNTCEEPYNGVFYIVDIRQTVAYFLVEVLLIKHKIQHFNHFKVCAMHCFLLYS